MEMEMENSVTLRSLRITVPKDSIIFFIQQHITHVIVICKGGNSTRVLVDLPVGSLGSLAGLLFRLRERPLHADADASSPCKQPRY